MSNPCGHLKTFGEGFFLCCWGFEAALFLQSFTFHWQRPLLLFPLCAEVWGAAGRTWLGFVALTTTNLVLHTPDVPRGTWRLLGRVKTGIFNLFFFSCCNKEQSMCCIYLNLEQNLFGKLLQIKPCILFMVGQTRRVKKLCQELLLSCASPRAMATLLCLVLLARIPEMVPGAWHTHPAS